MALLVLYAISLTKRIVPYQKDAKLETVFFQIYTKSHFRDLAKATDELTARMLQEDCDAFGLSLESLLVHQNLKMASPLNNSIFHPAEYLDFGVAREAVGYFCRQHKISAFANVRFPRKMSRSHALHSFREDKRRNKEMEGKQYRVLLSPQFLIDFQHLPGKEVNNSPFPPKKEYFSEKGQTQLLIITIDY